MKYRQLNGEERSVLAALRLVGLKPAEIARELGRHRSTVWRELKRNAAPYDGWYRARRAQQRAHARRYRSRRNSQFGRGQWERVEGLLREEWSPEQVSGHLRLKRELAISHETIYRHVWRDLRSGRHAARASARCAQELPETLRALRQPRATGGQANDRRAASRCGAAAPDRPLGDRHDDGREPRGEQPLHPDPGRAQERLPHDRQTPGAHRGRNQPRVAGPDGAASGADAHDHRGQRDRVPLVWPGGSGQSGASSTSPPRITAGSAGPTRTPTD